jgi:hypothetical protein
MASALWRSPNAKGAIEELQMLYGRDSMTTVMINDDLQDEIDFVSEFLGDVADELQDEHKL